MLDADKTKPLFCDTETVGFYGRIRLFQYYQEDWDNPLLIENPDRLTLAAHLQQYHTVWHNAHYDLSIIFKGYPAYTNFSDTFLLSRIALPHLESHALDNVMTSVLGRDPYAHLDKKAMQKTNWDVPTLTSQQKEYASIDVLYLSDVYNKVKEAEDSFSYKLDKHTLIACLDMQQHGLPVDSGRLHAAREAVTEPKLPINPNSPKQVCAYLGIDSSADNVLANLEVEGNKIAANVRKARKARKTLSFLNTYESYGDRVYGRIKPSARSGRLTSDHENLQQIPRHLKQIFGYEPDQGRVLVFADFSQLELRTIAAILNVTKMVSVFKEGGDLHGYTASQIFGPNYTKEERRKSKYCNFGLLYGIGIDAFIQMMLRDSTVLMPETEVARLRARWRNLWHEIYSWQQKGANKWRQGQLGSTPGGRRYKANRMTDFLNLENQGAGAEVAKLTLHYMHSKELPRLRGIYNEEINLLVCIHDSYIIDCPDDSTVYKDVAETLAKIMQRAWREMSLLFKVKDLPMPVEVSCGYNWGDIEKGINIWEHTYE